MENPEKPRWYQTLAMKAVLYSSIASSIFGFAAGCSEKPKPQPGVLTAIITASPNSGGKSLDVLLDGSASAKGDTGDITEYRFDFDGDGTDDYTENAANAPDGLFDGKTNHTYPTQGDFNSRLTIKDASGKESIDYDIVRVGFGTDQTGAMDYVDQKFYDAENWAPYRATLFSVLDRTNGRTDEYQYFIADVDGYNTSTGKSKFVIWDYDHLSPEQKSCLENRTQEDIEINPQIIFIEEDYSPETIGWLLGLE